jgi:signal-transduction protein with cAMP-binding, CBS, and nucleotidyltransferase domain
VVILKERFSKEMPVREIITEKVMFVGLDDIIEERMALIAEMRLRHVTFFEGDRLIGVISNGDVGEAIFSEQQLDFEEPIGRTPRVLS